MSRFARFLLLAACLLALAASAAQAQTCTTTLSVGANIATAVSGAANGATICLNSGNYGVVNLFNITRTGFVTLRSTTGVGAQMAPQIGNSRYIRFSSMTLQDVLVNSCSLNIEFLNTPWVVNSSGLMFDASACPNSTHNYLVDGATFDRVGMALYEGRLNCRDCNGVTIKNSIFTGIGSEASDGIQTQGNTRNITIGPNNQFSGILESLCGATHCDALQLQGGGTTLITQNYFKNGDTFIMSPDGCSNVTVEKNVFDGNGVAYDFNLQFGSCSNLIFNHNTLAASSVAFDSKTGGSATTATVTNNIFDANTDIKTANGAGCSGCTFSYNLATSTISGLAGCSGCTYSNNLVGSATHTGGATPSTWAGWELTPTSLGVGNASDGLNRGSTYFGTVIVDPPPVVASLTCTPTTIQSVGTTSCTATASNATSYTWAVTNCTAAQCTPSGTSSSTTYTCQYGGSCTPCVTATGPGGTSSQFCAAAGYLTVRYRKPTGFGAN